MINGVLQIVAAVLFAVISLNEGINIIWMGIAGLYLVVGIVNLIVHSVKVKKIEKAAKKAEKNQSLQTEAKPAAGENTTGG